MLLEIDYRMQTKADNVKGMKHTNSELTEFVNQLKVGNRVGHQRLNNLRWASSSIRLLRDEEVCQGHVAYGPDPRRSKSPSVWLGIVAQGPEDNSGQRFWVVYSGHNPSLASSEVSQRLYQRTLKGFKPDSTERLNNFNLHPSDQVEADLLDQLQSKPAASALESILLGQLNNA